MTKVKGVTQPHSKQTLNQRLQSRLNSAASSEQKQASGRGFGRVVVLIYAILAISATARATWQLIDHGHQAPLAYSLSLAAGIIYVLATVALAKGVGAWRVIAWVAVAIEGIGVLSVGIGTIIWSGSFPDQTVWSNFGQGYGYIPLILPIVGLIWLARTRPGPTPGT